MYRKNDPNQLAFEDFYLPFGGKLLSGNRWVVLSKQIPWEQVEAADAPCFLEADRGSPAKSSRLAFGALILKERLGVSDRERVAQITENPYLQYFLGFSSYQAEAPFHGSMLTHFRKRFSQEALAEINASIAQSAIEKGAKEAASKSDDQDDPPPKGKLIVDATCTPADISDPTDLNLVNEAREKTEAIIDRMRTFQTEKKKKPRTYRQKARAAYLQVAKQKNPGQKKIRKGIGKQLGYLRRNLITIAKMAEAVWLLSCLRACRQDLPDA